MHVRLSSNEMKERPSKKHVLFIQGAGEGAYEVDGLLAQSLRENLGEDYEVHYPRMPKDGEAAFHELRDRINKELASINGSVILVGHSAGGAVLVKYVSGGKLKKQIEGIFMISAPFLGKGGWELGEEDFPKEFSSRFPDDVPVHLYHSKDDEWVPFDHLKLFAKEIPEATIREFDGRGHQFNNDLSEVAVDIKNLPGSR
jgi:predicted alpha/beta hydrolase family esterase